MKKDENCLYCSRNSLQKELMIEICDLKTSTLFLFKEQSHPGRCVVAYKDHVNELFEISDEERNLFMQDVAHVARTLKKVFSPAKINMGAYSDTLAHLHFHIVPKYKDGLNFGSTFEMNPKKTYLTEQEYQQVIDRIKAQL
ncbi:MAG: HIT family protein [Bacteroidota bacterium]|nr:HIT family protein [Bacteroidota bacterium]